MFHSNPASDPIRYQTLAAAAQLLAEGNLAEWSYLFNQIRTHTESQAFVTLILLMREALKDRLEGPVMPGDIFGEAPAWESSLAPDKGDIPDAFKSAFEAD